ncbi:MAG: SGNH/GDSL hydrolase family protein [Planctomycetota bacterium]
MQWKTLRLTNCAELTDVPGGVRPQRYPEAVRSALGQTGQNNAVKPSNLELRWVAEDFANGAEITLASEGVTRLTAFFGSFVHAGNWRVGPGEPVTLRVAPVQGYLESIDRLPSSGGFDPRVARLMCLGDPVHLIDLRGAVRPPADHETPARRLLAYGTSITHGNAATAPHLTYPAMLARRLGVDLINLGLGGSCLCEPEVADYIAARDDWDLAVFALSVNMANQRFTVETFRDRVSNVIHRAARAHPDKPIFCVTLWPYFADVTPEMARNAKADPAVFRQALRDAVNACPTGNVTLLEGPDLLADFAGLTTDLLHPSDLGFIEMAGRLADAIGPAIH